MMIIKYFVNKYNRSPTYDELKDLVSRRFPLIDNRYKIKLNKMIEFGMIKKEFEVFLDEKKE